MLGKVFLFAVLLALSRGDCGDADECQVTQLGPHTEESECGDVTTVRFTNCTIISVETELFENETHSVVELDSDPDTCYVIVKSGHDGDFTAFEETLDEDVANDIQITVPECEGRSIKLEVPDEGNGRKKRQGRRFCVVCRTIRIRRGRFVLRIRRCRLFRLSCSVVRRLLG